MRGNQFYGRRRWKMRIPYGMKCVEYFGILNEYPQLKPIKL